MDNTIIVGVPKGIGDLLCDGQRPLQRQRPHAFPARNSAPVRDADYTTKWVVSEWTTIPPQSRDLLRAD